MGRGNSGRPHLMRRLFIPLALVPAPALADVVTLKPIVEARLRYENVDQAGIAKTADALTLRMRAGVEAKKEGLAFLAEAEGTLAILEDHNSGLNGRAAYPIVADPQNIELNRLQLQFTGIPKTVVTVGRQRINLDDQRFVGSVGWRQNEQTFDAARVEWAGVKGLKADVTYAWSTRSIWGVDGFGARQQSVSGDNLFVNLAYKSKNFGLTGFAYLVDQDEAAVQAFRLSSQTFGLRANAKVPLRQAKLEFVGSYARQSDYRRNPNDYSADYWLGEAAFELAGLRLTGGYEVLRADNGGALTSFQTPLATLHKFNGTADKFLITPANGLRDLYVGLSAAFPKAKALPGLNAAISWHRFESDRLGLDYGHEWDAQLGWKIGKKVVFLAKTAFYDRKGAADFGGDADTEKLWLQLDYIF